MRRFAALFVALSCSFVLAGGEVRVAKSWSANAGPTDEVKKILVVGISTNQESRRHFENRFVSHLRGRGYDGATSHSMVEDLGNIENRRELLDRIAALPNILQVKALEF